MMKIRFVVLMFLVVSALCGTSATAQSRDRESPTPIVGTTIPEHTVHDDGGGGSTAYFYSVNVEPGTIRATLTFTPPSTGGSMSVIFSGIECCDASSGLGGDRGDGREHTSESDIIVRRAQRLLVEVYIDAGANGGDFTFTLLLEGSVGGTGKPVCPDLSVNIVRAQSLKVGAKQVRVEIAGTIRNETTGDFISTEGQQSLKIFQSSPTVSGWTVVFTQPFTSLRGRGSQAFIFGKTYTTAEFTRLRPNFKVEIVYNGTLASDDDVRNDDCGAANNSKTIAFETIKNPR